MRWLGLALLLVVWLLPAVRDGDTTHTQTVVQCQEDQPCWDCTTMGDHKCGKR